MKPATLVVFRMLGAVLAVLSGAAALLSIAYAWHLPFQAGQGYAFLAATVLTMVSGWLLRTWWALLAVPVLFFLGLMAAFDYQSGPLGDPTISFSLRALWLGFVYSLLFYVYLVGEVVIGAAIGTGVAKWMEARGWFPRRQK
jgi:hypothetical protein